MKCTCTLEYDIFSTGQVFPCVGCVTQLVERRSLIGELSLSCARPPADG